MMQKTLKIKLATEDIKYLKNVVKITEHELKRFSLATKEEQKVLIGKTFSRKLLTLLNTTKKKVSFSLACGKIVGKKTYKVVVDGYKEYPDKKDPFEKVLKEVQEKYTIDTEPVFISDFYFEGNKYLVCTINAFEDQLDKDFLLNEFKQKPEVVKDLNEFKGRPIIKISEEIEQFEFWENLITAFAKNMVKPEEDEREMLKHLFDTLSSETLSVYPGETPRPLAEIKGKEAVFMSKIYENAKKTYPLFKDLPFDKQLEVLNEGFLEGKKNEDTKRDIYLFAKSTFEVFDKKDLNKTVYYEGNKCELIKRHLHRNCLMKYYLKWVELSYNCRGNTFRKGVDANDLWLLLSGGKALIHIGIGSDLEN